MVARVMVVDDSMIVRQILKDIIDSDPRFECKWTAVNGVSCIEQLKSDDCNPDVITLDVEMPHLGGLETLRELLRIKPLPVIMIVLTEWVSSLNKVMPSSTS